MVGVEYDQRRKTKFFFSALRQENCMFLAWLFIYSGCRIPELVRFP